MAHPRLGPGRYHLRLVEFLFCDGGGQTGSMSVSISLVRSRPPERLRPPAGLSSPSRPCPARTAAPHPWCRRTRPQGSSSRTRTWRKTLTFFFLSYALRPPAPSDLGYPVARPRPCRLALRATLHHQPGPPPRRLTWPCQRPTPQPAAACLPRALLPLLPRYPAPAHPVPYPCYPAMLPCHCHCLPYMDR